MSYVQQLQLGKALSIYTENAEIVNNFNTNEYRELYLTLCVFRKIRESLNLLNSVQNTFFFSLK